MVVVDADVDERAAGPGPGWASGACGVVNPEPELELGEVHDHSPESSTLISLPITISAVPFSLFFSLSLFASLIPDPNPE